MEKWEYKTLVVEAADLEALLIEVGEQGWELLAMVAAPITHEKTEGDTVSVWETVAYRLVFKRRKLR